MRCLSKPRMNTVTTICGACATPSGPGTHPGLMVEKRKRPASSVRQRPKPRNPASIGLSCASSGCAYLPWALACQISTTASLTGLPSPATMRPARLMRSPPTPAAARSTTTDGAKPMLTYGPTVCDEVVSWLMTASAAGRFHRRRVATAQHDVVAKRKSGVGQRRLPIEAGDHAPTCPVVGHAVVHRIVFEKRIAGKVHLGHQALHQAHAKQREVQMRRPPRVVVVTPRIGTRTDGHEAVAALAIGQ